ncbi:MAG TPA: SRPBCC family protein [Solirubrobacteraceae bacterium]|nr:SRPBCC family protein [Solirubrobacteraceae bacterium]
MPTVRASRTIAAPADELWELVSDPHHLPRWWPRVARVEDVRDGAFTEVMKTKKGKVVRADFDVVCVDAERRTLRWEQRVAGTPFERVLLSSATELSLAAAGGETGEATAVTLELRQTPGRQLPRFGGGYVMRRAGAKVLREALDGLERISV